MLMYLYLSGEGFSEKQQFAAAYFEFELNPTLVNQQSAGGGWYLICSYYVLHLQDCL